jgi:hypothetical protein
VRQLRRDESLFRYVKDKIQCVIPREDRADNGNWIDITITEGRIDLLFACRLAYTSSVLMVLRT